MNLLTRLGVLPMLVPAMLNGSTYVFSPGSSTLSIYVPKAGLLSFAGHDHTIEATEFSGTLELEDDDWSEAVLELTVASASLEVLDRELGDEEREKVAAKMASDEVLGMERFPRIRFTSEAMERKDPKTIKVEGTVRIRDISAPVSFEAKVKLANSTSLLATGSVILRLADFGIEPVKALGGLIQTDEEIEVKFEFIGTNSEHF